MPGITLSPRPLALAAALLLAVPAAAQRHESNVIHVDGNHRLEVRLSGQVDFNDEGDWVTAVGPGGRLLVEERGRGDDRRVEFTPGGDGGVAVRYLVDGRARALDEEGRAWARRVIREAVRENGLGAERRVARIRARRGVGGVLEEVAGIRSDVAKRVYYRALLASGPMSGAEFGRVMDDVRQRVRSDVETRLVLVEAVDHAEGGRLAAVLRAAEGIDSDVETRLVLHRALERHRLEDAAARAAFFRAVEGIGSDVETRLVLHQAAARLRLAEGDTREAFFRAVDRMESDVERRIVLSSVLRGDAPEATVVAALGSARGMRSDVERRIVLMQVPARLLRSPRVSAAYRAVVDAMGSDVERSLALRRLANETR
ncbi:MAG TPA: hypothetical protein VFX98_08465 [Longimicrobiaceae bacterium]|nr:hypothetical protein [Longimicrobiaceae bacterium]